MQEDIRKVVVLTHFKPLSKTEILVQATFWLKWFHFSMQYDRDTNNIFQRPNVDELNVKV